MGVIGELGLDGSIKPLTGVLSMVYEARPLRNETGFSIRREWYRRDGLWMGSRSSESGM